MVCLYNRGSMQEQDTHTSEEAIAPAEMQRSPQDVLLNRSMRIVVIGLSVFLVLLFLMVAVHRVRYPYEVEQLEGNMVLSVNRVLAHQPVYVAPNTHFIPFMYPPLYLYASAAMARLTGAGYLPLRLLSILCSLGCFAGIYLFVWRETQRHVYAIAAAALYAGSFPLCANWYDLARLDSMFVFLLLIALMGTRWLSPLAAAFLWLPVFWTKQSILPVAFVMLASQWTKRKQALLSIVVLGVGAWLTVFLMDRATSGWFSFYVFHVPAANSDLQLRPLALYLPLNFLHPFGVASLLLVVAILWLRPTFRSATSHFYLGTLSVFFLCWFVMMHSGSTGNVLMPVYALLAIGFGIAAARLEQGCSPRIKAVVLLAIAIQLGGLVYNPGQFFPSQTERADAEQTLKLARSLDGEIYIAQHPYEGTQAGAPEYVDLTALHDAMRALPEPQRIPLRAAMQKELESDRIQGVLFDGALDADSVSGKYTTDALWLQGFPVHLPLLRAKGSGWILLRKQRNTVLP